MMAINLKTLKKEWVMPVGPTPAGIVMTPDNRYLLVGIMGEGYVEVIDWKTQKTVKKVPTDTAAHNLHPRGDGRYYFVSNRSVGGGSVSLLDTQTLTVVEKYDVPSGPDDMEVRADGSELWATARFARRVQVIDLKTKTAEGLDPRRQLAARCLLPQSRGPQMSRCRLASGPRLRHLRRDGGRRGERCLQRRHST